MFKFTNVCAIPRFRNRSMGKILRENVRFVYQKQITFVFIIDMEYRRICIMSSCKDDLMTVDMFRNN